MAINKEDEDQVHELRDLEVQEVSLVDRPANKRKFLIVKNAEADSMAKGAEMKKDGQGSLEEGDKLSDDGNTAAGDASGSADNDAGDDAGDGDEFEEVELSDLTIDEDVAKAMGSALARAAKRLAALAAAVQNAEKEKGAKASPALMRQVSAIARTLSGFGGSDDKDKSGDKDKAKKDEPLDLDAVAADIEDEVEKAGRKMSRRRLAQLRAARDTIDKILGEVDDDAKDEAKKSADLVATVADLAKKVELLTKASTDQQTIIKSQSEALRKAKSTRTTRKSGEVDDDDSSEPVKKQSWPTNFNSEETPEEEIFR